MKRWIAAMLLCLSAIAFFPTYSAMAAPNATLIAADLGDQIQEKTSEDAGRAKNFIRDTADSVKETANKNAKRVDQATDDGSFVEGKAKRDADRIEKRAEEDTARTQKAVDNTKNVIERTVDSIKDVFSN
ncbi:hypothetical protein [Gloeocapsopsis dulcis]|uniref:hypothetical protein n=1 Tax=Gloeocapsopsis dulcis TaxID=2859516 RepID=UPI0030DB5584